MACCVLIAAAVTVTLACLRRLVGVKTGRRGRSANAWRLFGDTAEKPVQE